MIKKYLKRYFVDAMSFMALGLFSSLIVGLIISQLAKIPHLEILSSFSGVLAASSPVVGGAIGAAIAYGLKSKPLVVFSWCLPPRFSFRIPSSRRPSRGPGGFSSLCCNGTVSFCHIVKNFFNLSFSENPFQKWLTNPVSSCAIVIRRHSPGYRIVQNYKKENEL